MQKKWRVEPVNIRERDRLVEEVGCSAIAATLLLNRGIRSSAEAAGFFESRLADLHDPFLLPDMSRAVERIEHAVRHRELIAVCGDYDVDGLSATALLMEFFLLLDYPVRTHVPSRLKDGYGLNSDTILQLAREGVRLIITVDNGSSAVEEIALANEKGMDVVVTDHHQPPPIPPSPLAMVNPWAAGSSYPFSSLAGVGVVFKLVWAISQRFSRSRKLSPRFKEFMMDSLALVALGTISDVVPLCGENRILATHGLAALERSPRPGFQRLVEFALRGKRERLRAEHVAFRIGPAINAAGRLGNAQRALQLLTTTSDEEARELVALLERENRRRQQIERQILDAVRARVQAEVDFKRDRAIVLADPDWHPGVIGIVASRIVEEFWRPTLLISLQDGRGRGSARTFAGVHIFDALKECQEHLVAFGGHAHAAGVEVLEGQIDALRQSLNRAIPVPPEEMVPELKIEAEISLGELNRNLLDELSRFEPHGNSNQPPLFSTHQLELAGAPRVMGQDGQHLSFFVKPNGGPGGRAIKAVAFRQGKNTSSLLAPGVRVALAFRPMVNTWRGSESIELNVKEFHTS